MKDNKKRPLENHDLSRSLEQSHTILKGVIDSPRNVVIFALDPQYQYLAFSQSHCQTMKKIWGEDIALGNSMLDYIKNPDDRVKAKANFDRALSGESFTLEEEYGDIEMERRYYENNYNPIIDKNSRIIGLTLFLTDITDRKRAEDERDRLITELKDALQEVKSLRGLLPICSNCKKIRDDKGYWGVLESYIEAHSEAKFSHGICPDCSEKLYGRHSWYKKKQTEY